MAGQHKSVDSDEHTPKTKTHHQILTSMAAGACAGALAKTVIAPLDRTKINFQVSSTKTYSFSAAFRFLKSSFQNEGVFALWRGNSATMVRVIPFAAIQFASHEQWKKVLSVDVKDGGSTPVFRFVAGSLAGITATSITYPLDLARSMMAITKSEAYPNIFSVFRSIWLKNGFFSLYRGLSAALMGTIPYAGTSFFTYETLKIMRREQTQLDYVEGYERLIFGAVAGLTGQSASYPLDIVKKRLSTGRHPKKISNPIKLLLYIGRTEGIIKGLYKGLSMNFIKGPIAVGISFSTFDSVVRFLRLLPYFKNYD